MSEKRRVVRKPVPRAADTEPPQVATDPIATRTPEFPRLAAAAGIVRLEEGLYALGIGPMPRLPDCSPQVALPAIFLSAPPARPRTAISTKLGTASFGCGAPTPPIFPTMTATATLTRPLTPLRRNGSQRSGFC